LVNELNDKRPIQEKLESFKNRKNGGEQVLSQIESFENQKIEESSLSKNSKGNSNFQQQKEAPPAPV
jgi:hypothetical protein